jgi:hypothetical protein
MEAGVPHVTRMRIPYRVDVCHDLHVVLDKCFRVQHKLCCRQTVTVGTKDNLAYG